MGVGVADDDPRRVGALRLEDPQLVQADRRQDGVGRDREAGPAGRPGGGAMDALLAGREPRLVGADLADDAGPDAGVPDSVGRLADELVGEVVDGPAVDRGLGRVVGVAVPAAAHDEVEAGRRREPDEPRRVAPDAGQRQVDQARAARLPERGPAPRG